MKESHSRFIIGMTYLAKSVFWTHLLLLFVLTMFDYIDPLRIIHGEKAEFTIRGNVNVSEENWKPLRMNNDVFTKDSIGVTPIFLMKKAGFARIDFTDFTKAFNVRNTLITMLDIACLWIWLILTYQLMKIIASLKSNIVFDMQNIKRLKLIALIFGIAPLLNSVKNYMFAGLVNSTIQIPHHTIYVARDFPLVPIFINANVLSGLSIMLLIIILAEVFSYGLSLKQENDLTI